MSDTKSTDTIRDASEMDPKMFNVFILNFNGMRELVNSVEEKGNMEELHVLMDSPILLINVLK